MVAANEHEHPLNPICMEWLALLKEAERVKKEQFGQFADEAWRFYDSSHDFMWKEEYAQRQGGFLDRSAGAALPTFRMTVNRPFEAVALFGPSLFHRYPNVVVTPSHYPEVPPEVLGIDMNDPYMAAEYQQQQMMEMMEKSRVSAHAAIKQHYLNWLQVEGRKKDQVRPAITESIVKGMGLLWVEMYRPRGSGIQYPRSTYGSVDDLLLDPDACYWEDVQWVARKCVHPKNLVEREYGLQPGDLKGHLESYAQQSKFASRRGQANRNRAQGKSHDLVCYWKIWSKNGFGDRLKSTNYARTKSKYDFSGFGDMTFLALAEGVPFPLNMPSWSLGEDPQQVFDRSQWPIPYWTDSGWPFAGLWYHSKGKTPWPKSMFEPVIGELRFVNWCMSFLADKVAASSTTYVGVLKQAGVEIQKQLAGGHSPFTVLEISNFLGKKIDEVISFLQAPAFSIDIWKMVSEVLDMIDKRVGTTELIYGLTGKQMRSAEEANIKSENINIRPDEMASRVEDWLSDTAMKEIEAIIWKGEEQDVAPVLGQTAARVFTEQIQTEDFDRVVRDFTYRIEAGSARKPNKENRIRSLNEFGQVALPTIQEFAVNGHVGPWNAYMAEMGKAMDLDATPFLIELPPPEEQGPSEEEIAAQQAAAELEMDQQRHVQEMDQSAEEHDQDLELAREKHEQEMELAKQKMKLDQQAGKQKIAEAKQRATAQRQAARRPAASSRR